MADGGRRRLDHGCRAGRFDERVARVARVETVFTPGVRLDNGGSAGRLLAGKHPRQTSPESGTLNRQ
jgi:hypothetical protein